jgi:hypothetical protein
MTERPLVETARREALLCGAIFVAAITYTIGYCTTHGYTGDAPQDLKFVLGFPEWIFYGILAPWAVCTVFAAIFSFGIMTDHDLSGEEGAGMQEPAGEHTAEDSTADVSENEEPPRE